MKILYAVRLFSGFETSIIERRWNPTGAPTIYKVMQALDREAEPRFVLTCKETYVPWQEERDVEFPVVGLRHPVRVLANPPGAARRFGRFGPYVNELRQTMTLFNLARTERPDVMYVSSANFVAGALVARYTSVPVVLRIMGVYPAQRAALTGTRWVHRVSRWAYRSPFACVVCTQDGSGGESWLDRAFGPAVRRELFVNGVDAPAPADGAPDQRLAALPEGRTVVAFVGKLEYDKGAGEFMRGFLDAWERSGRALHALVVGTGKLADDMARMARERGAAEDVTFIDRLPHSQIPAVHARADVYVSLNRLGNLSNANLEAMRGGSCMVFPEAQPEVGVDVATDELVPQGAVARIPSADDTGALAETLLRLHAAPEERERMRRAIRDAADAFLPTWNERVAQEMDLLREIAHTKTPERES